MSISLLTLIVISVINQRYSRQYRWSDDVGNLGCWALNVSLAAVAVSWVTPLYHVFFNARIWTPLPDTLTSFIVAVIAYDFLYYWFHRSSHALKLLWNIHSVHHQAQRLTPSLGLRSSAFDFAAIWLILGPMLWLGFSSQHIIAALGVHALYQVLLHNDFRTRLGLLEYVLNTPHHHRLHHATNPRYIDKNFGSILIVWDRLFGTFAPQSEKPVIGVSGSCYVSDPLRSNVAPWLSAGTEKVQVEQHLNSWNMVITAIMVAMVLLQIYGAVLSTYTTLAVVTGCAVAIFFINRKKAAI